jgi:PII-like signaling protein
VKLEGKAKMLRIHFGEDDKWQGKPLYRAIVEKCRELDIAGATVYRGIEGYGASTLIHRPHLLSFSSDAWIRRKKSRNSFPRSIRWWTKG